MNWTDDDEMIENHPGRSVVVVRWDWIDLGWMERLGSTAIVPMDLADEETSEDGVQRDCSIPKAIFVLLLPLLLDYQVRMELGHRAAEEHLQGHPANATINQRGLRVQPNAPLGDGAVVAYPDDQDAVEEDVTASREGAELPVGGN